MPKLYIGNATKQRHAFAFNPPDAGGDDNRRRTHLTQVVPPLHVEPLSGDWTIAQIDAIIDQHKPYGFVEISEIDRTKAFTGLCYSIDKPIPRERLLGLLEANTQALDKRGREMREMAAVAVNNEMELQMREQRMPGKLAKIEMVVEEERSDRSNTEETVPQRIRVTRGEEGDNAPRGRKRAA
jgi:hypothetical protein